MYLDQIFVKVHIILTQKLTLFFNTSKFPADFDILRSGGFLPIGEVVPLQNQGELAQA